MFRKDNPETLRNIFRRAVEDAKPATFAERMRLQADMFQRIATTFGARMTPDNIEYWGAQFAEVCPSESVRK